MARRGSSVSDLKKKRKDLFKRPDSAIGRTKNSNQKKVEEKKTTKKLTGKERAQKMARERIAAKKAGTYKKPKTAQELAKARLKIKKKK